MRSTIVTVSLVALTLAACGGEAPQPLAPADVPAAFIALTQAADRTMHMEWSGTYAMGGRGAMTTPFTATLDFAGNNFAGTVSSSSGAPDFKPGTETTTQIAYVDGQAYQFTPYSSGWQAYGSGNGNGMPTNLDPMRGLTVQGVEYVGAEERGGASVHRLRVTDLTGIANGLFSSLVGSDQGPTQFAGEDSSFDVYVDATAHPLSATLNLSTGAEPSDFGTISMTAEYVFSNWGIEMYIVAPPVVNQPDQPGVGIPEKPPVVMP
jgi:hypothetical protein